MSQEPALLKAATNAQLPGLALAALANGELRQALLLSDRWRKIDAENIQCLLLRAEASHKLGKSAEATQDLAKALELGPSHRLANRRLLLWGDAKQALNAARSLIGNDNSLLAECYRAMEAGDQFGSGRIWVDGHSSLQGWIAWKKEESASLIVDGKNQMSIHLNGAPDHPYAKNGWIACDISLPDLDKDWRSIRVVVRHQDICRLRTLGAKNRTTAEEPFIASDETVTIIVPVYDDLAATRLCLESVGRAIDAAPFAHAVVIEDASPDPEIRQYLLRFADRPRWTLLRNEQNLGYINSCNRASSLVTDGDVILLNADTIAPTNFVTILKKIARSDPKIGTINPLSNNGEFVSFPEPLRNNSMLIAEPAARASEHLATAFLPVDIPSGTGFCLYVTRSCLRAIGKLSTAFQDGYFEDADFGLRAREAGFRNVCAPFLFVVHLGSRSFKQEKADLVAKNRKILARRFPTYESECRAFMAIDPLKPIRGRLEMAAAPEERLRLLVGPIAAEPLLLERTRQISGERYAMLLIDGPRLRLRGYDRVPTRSIDIDSNAPDALADLMDFLRRWPIDRIEATGLKYVARQIYSAISSLRFPIDLLVAGKADVEDISRHNEDHTFDLLIPLDPMSAMLVGRTALFEQSCAPQSQQNDGALAILLPFETPSALLLCISITKHLSRDDQQVVVLGGSIIEERLIARGLFVTGPVTVDETPEVMARYNIGRLFLPYRESHYWTLHRIRRHCFASACFFDWSEKEFPHGANGDLALSSALSDENVATAVLNWARAGSKMGAA